MNVPACDNPDGARRDAGEFGERHAQRGGAPRDRSREPGQQVPHAIHGHGALDGAKVHRPGSAPGHALNGDRAAHGADGGDHRDEQE